MVTRFNNLGSWGSRFRSVPHYFFYYYVPTRYTGLSHESQCIRQGIWDFKQGKNQGFFIDQIERKIRHTFENPSLLTLVCIPASTTVSNSARFERFSNDLCSRLNMANGFYHVSICKEKTPSHLGGEDSAAYNFDRSFFYGKKVVLFDDVVTKGRSMYSFIDYLNGVGADVVFCISIGKTFWDRTMDYQVNNPWTGAPAFIYGSPCAPDNDNREIQVKPAITNVARVSSSDDAVSPVKVASIRSSRIDKEPTATTVKSVNVSDKNSAKVVKETTATTVKSVNVSDKNSAKVVKEPTATTVKSVNVSDKNSAKVVKETTAQATKYVKRSDSAIPAQKTRKSKYKRAKQSLLVDLICMVIQGLQSLPKLFRKK